VPISNAGHVSGKVAVVTGGARGMGAAYVCALAREGAIVAGTDIIDDLGASLAEQLQSEGRDVSYYHHDVTSRAGWEAVVASVQQAHRPIDVLVNNAGVQVRSMGIEADDRGWDLWEQGGRTRIRVWAADGKRPGPCWSTRDTPGRQPGSAV
jgi:NAD(P)-dependent dehydrogenase (short-subunit alcohol dehydrogenase family)